MGCAWGRYFSTVCFSTRIRAIFFLDLKDKSPFYGVTDFHILDFG